MTRVSWMISQRQHHRNEFIFVDFIDAQMPANDTQTEQSTMGFMYVCE